MVDKGKGKIGKQKSTYVSVDVTLLPLLALPS
jgi:hypothetical protein